MTRPPPPPGSFRSRPDHHIAAAAVSPTTATCCAAPAHPTTPAGSPTPPPPAAACARPAHRAAAHRRDAPPAASSTPATPPPRMPDGVLYVPCGDRRASICPPCAETYRADTYQLIRAGLAGGKGVPSIRRHPSGRVRHAHRAVLRARAHPPGEPQDGKVAPAGCAATSPSAPRRRLICTARTPTPQPHAAGSLVPGLLRPRPRTSSGTAGAGELWRAAPPCPPPTTQDLGNAPTASNCGLLRQRSPNTNAAASCTSRPSSPRPADPSEPDAILRPTGRITAADLGRSLRRQPIRRHRVRRNPGYPNTTHSWPIAWGSPARHPPLPSARQLTAGRAFRM
jgi:hypothetical protein